MKEKIKRLFASIAAILMAIGLIGANAVPVMAEDKTANHQSTDPEGQASVDSGLGGNGSITITLPSNTGTTTNYNYKLYKIFDATYDATSEAGTGRPTAYSYTGTNVPSISGDDETVNKFWKDDENNIYYGTLHNTQVDNSIKIRISNSDKYLVPVTGELSSTDSETVSAAFRQYLGLDTQSPTAPTVSVNVANSYTTLKISNLPYAYYYITTNAGAAVALTSTNPDATIASKNDVPTVDKTIEAVNSDASSLETTKGSIKDGKKNAIAELGSTVHYKAVIDVKKGAANYIFTDKMDDTLSYVTGSVSVQQQIGTAAATDVTKSDNTYTLDETKSDNSTFKISFNNTFIYGLGNQQNADTPVKLIVTYRAIVKNGNLIQNVPARNAAKIQYGSDVNNLHSSPESVTNVYNAKISVTKYVYSSSATDNKGSVLPNAEFVLKNSDGKFYHYKTESGKDPVVEWVDSEENASKFTSNSNGVLNYTYTVGSTTNTLDGFTGLSNGTYTLHETKAPDGYNKAADSTITINGANVDRALENSNLQQSTFVLDVAGSLLPSTGGIGTTIFYIAGGILIIGAAVLLIARRKKNA